jgi:thiamine pyrophosphate-dependent acetolactate synthase large subunit-like protein
VTDQARAQYGSDVVAELLRALDIEYAAFNPGASFRGLHDSLVNTGSGAPRVITCTHEEISVAIAHGYAKAAGRPMVAALHDVVGLQHACMAIYNAWCDRVPIILLGGTGPVAADRRRPWIDWIHTANVQGNHIREFVKWDDQPATVPAAVESIVRGWRLATTAPHAPVYICLPVEVQEDRLESEVALPDLRLHAPARPGPDPHAVEEAGRLLLDAQRPVIIADRSSDSVGAFDALARVSALVGAPLLDRGGRMNVSTANRLDLTGDDAAVLAEADVVLAAEVYDLAGALAASGARSGRPTTIHITLADALVGSWTADYQRLAPVDVPIMADAGLALAAIIDRIEPEAGRLQHRNGARIAADEERHHALRRGWLARASAESEGSPVAVPRLALDVWQAIGGRKWVLAAGSLDGWARRVWDWTEPGQYLGTNGGAGIGYGPGATIGAALAHRRDGTLTVSLQPDGDLLYTPSALWTLAHEELRTLIVVWDNHSYFNSEEHARRIARQRGRPPENAGIGTRIESPNVDHAAMARSFGVHAEGPIDDTRGVPDALQRALRVTDEGRPAVVHVVAQER